LILGSLVNPERACREGPKSSLTDEENAPPTSTEEKAEEDEGRRALWEAFEEDAHPPLSDVQTGQSIRFSKRRWQESLLQPMKGCI
jgi:hypothetical protein